MDSHCIVNIYPRVASHERVKHIRMKQNLKTSDITIIVVLELADKPFQDSIELRDEIGTYTHKIDKMANEELKLTIKLKRSARIERKRGRDELELTDNEVQIATTDRFRGTDVTELKDSKVQM